MSTYPSFPMVMITRYTMPTSSTLAYRSTCPAFWSTLLAVSVITPPVFELGTIVAAASMIVPRRTGCPGCGRWAVARTAQRTNDPHFPLDVGMRTAQTIGRMDVEPRGVERHIQSDAPLYRLFREDDGVVLIASGVRGHRHDEVLTEGHFILDAGEERRRHRRGTQRTLRVAQRRGQVEEPGGVRCADGLASHRGLIGVPGLVQ